jgi:hypothetical protein
MLYIICLCLLSFQWHLCLFGLQSGRMIYRRVRVINVVFMPVPLIIPVAFMSFRTSVLENDL